MGNAKIKGAVKTHESKEYGDPDRYSYRGLHIKREAVKGYYGREHRYTVKETPKAGMFTSLTAACRFIDWLDGLSGHPIAIEQKEK